MEIKYCWQYRPNIDVLLMFYWVEEGVKTKTFLLLRPGENRTQNDKSTFPNAEMSDRRNSKKRLVLCNSFCKACFAFKSCKNNALLKLPLPAKNSDNNISCMRGKISTLWWRFLCWNLHPLVRSVIVWICCWQQDFQQALFMQLLIAQQALQKELQNTKMFFQHFHSEYMYCLYTAIWTAIGQKNILRFGNSSANIVLHSKAAKTKLDAIDPPSTSYAW